MLENSNDWNSQANSAYAQYQSADIKGLQFPDHHKTLFSGNGGLGPQGIADGDPTKVVVSDRANWVDGNGTVILPNRVTQTPGT